MKYCIRFGIVLAAFLICGPGYGQRKPKIKGNRSVITVDKPLGAFSHLSITDDLEVELKSGNNETIRIEADDNLIDILRFNQESDTLKVSSFYTITGSKKLKLTLTYKSLSTIRVESGSVISDERINSDEIDLMLLDGSKANLEIGAALVRLRMDGNASSELQITSDSLRVTMAGQSTAFIYSSNPAMDINLSGRASATLEGAGRSLMLSMTDNSTLKGEDMEVPGITALLNASAQARVHALEELSYEGRDKSKLFVYGEPSIRVLGFYDTAELHKAKQ